MGSEIELEEDYKSRREELPLTLIIWLALTVIAGAVTLLVWTWP